MYGGKKSGKAQRNVKELIWSKGYGVIKVWAKSMKNNYLDYFGQQKKEFFFKKSNLMFRGGLLELTE